MEPESLIEFEGNFYPRPPRGGRRLPGVAAAGGELDFYPRPPRGGRPGRHMEHSAYLAISIHVLREEDDAAG